jgi:hypothetical protein
MKPKHYLAFLATLGSLCYFAMISVSQLETLTTVKARLLFTVPFIIALFAGVAGLCFLFVKIKFPKN